MKTQPGDIVQDQLLGRGMVVYHQEGKPVCAFPTNPELMLCDDAWLTILGNINQLPTKNQKPNPTKNQK